MLDQTTRMAILKLHEAGHGTRTIARSLGLSRGAVKTVIASRLASVPPLARAELGEPYRDRILELFESCKGNLVRVHEELVAGGAELSYPALTAFCRRYGIGHEPPPPAGEYCFAPGQEMQHDTSPHDVKLGGKVRRVQTASLVLCHSRMLFFQIFPRFIASPARSFSPTRCVTSAGRVRVMIDNTHVVVLRAAADMEPVPEMAAFAERLGFRFVAHEIGDANRSARVERPFHFIENNFLAGRTSPTGRSSTARREPGATTSTRPTRNISAPSRASSSPSSAPPETAAALGARGLPAASAHGGLRRLRQRQPLLVAPPPAAHRPPRRSARNQGEDRGLRRPRLVASHKRLIDGEHVRVIDPAHRPPRGEGSHARGNVSHEETALVRRPPSSRLCREPEASRPDKVIALCAGCCACCGLSPRPLLEAVRVAARYGLYDPRPGRTHDPAPLTREYFRLPV